MQLYEACDRMGVLCENVPADNQWHQAGLKDKQHSSAGRIMLFADGSGGIVYNWVLGEHVVFWHDDSKSLSPEEYKKREKMRKEALKKAESDRKHRASIAAKIASKVYAMSARADDSHPYIVKKQIECPEYLNEMPAKDLEKAIGYAPKARKEHLLTGRILIIPIGNSTEITSLGFIDEAGRKAFLSGGTISGSFWMSRKISNGDIIYLAEGIATAMSISMMTDMPCISVMSSTGFAKCLPVLKKWLTNSTFIVCADIGNGYEHAKAAADQYGCSIIAPVCETGGTDFNDMMIECEDAAREILMSALPEVHNEYECKSLADIEHMDIPPTRWIVEKLMPEGCHILGGSPKIGKSFLALDLSLTVTNPGRKLFGEFNVNHGSCLYLALEDSWGRIKSRTETIKSGLPAWNAQQAKSTSEAKICIKWPPLGKGCMEMLEQHLSDVPDTKLVIVDTLQKIRPAPSGRNSNAYEVDYTVVSEFQQFAIKHHIAVILITHLRKSTMSKDEDPFEQITGSMGISGAADSTYRFRRGQNSEIAELYVRGRDVEEQCINLKSINAVWHYMGDSEQSPAHMNEIREYVNETGKREIQPADFNRWYRANYGSEISGVRVIFKRLYDSGHIKKIKDGFYALN